MEQDDLGLDVVFLVIPDGVDGGFHFTQVSHAGGDNHWFALLGYVAQER